MTRNSKHSDVERDRNLKTSVPSELHANTVRVSEVPVCNVTQRNDANMRGTTIGPSAERNIASNVYQATSARPQSTACFIGRDTHAQNAKRRS